MKIGIFDSGVGGEAVAIAITRAMPDAELDIRDDKSNLPYGTKTHEELVKLVVPILLDMQHCGCQVIVIACNTVTTNIIGRLRQLLDVPLIGIEPMVKPAAALSKTKKIAVCATPATLGSARYKQLKERYCKNIEVFEPDCADWAQMIQDNEVNETLIRQRIEPLCRQGVDVVVLGCTHYHWIEDEIRQIAGKYAAVIQPEQPVIAQLRRVLAQLA